jgi:hypothetical protein
VKDKIRQRTIEAYKLETNLMKKIIALAVATAISAPAMADLTLGAAARYQVDNSAGVDTDTATNYVDLKIAGTSTAESGLFVSAGATIRVTPAATAKDGDVKMTVGNAMAKVSLGDVESAGVYTDGSADQFRVGQAAVQARVTGRNNNNVVVDVTAVEGLTLQASANMLDSSTRLVAGYDLGMAKVALGLDSADGAAVTSDAMQLDVSTTVGGVALGLSHASVDNATDDSSTAIRAGYMGLNVTFESHEVANVDYDNWMASYAIANAGGVEGFTVTVGAADSDTTEANYGVRLDYAF